MDSYTDEKAKNGKKGGKKTMKVHGSKHFSKIGKKGAKSRWSKKESNI